ncbi:MAG: hypothetical protein HKN29_10415 [Rhodothermales bacterium]|nr:hypothetical protein [Rhodothermales bacterium]
MRCLKLILISALIAGGVDAQSRAFRESIPLFGGTATVITYAPTRADAAPLIEQALAEMKGVETRMTESGLFDHPLPFVTSPDPEMARLINRALGWARTTGGAFDPTRVAADHTSRAAGSAPADWRDLDFDLMTQELTARSDSIRLDSRVIGPAFALDAATAALDPSSPVLLSHSLGLYRAMAPPPGQAGWRVNISDPTESGDLDASVVLADAAYAVWSLADTGSAPPRNPEGPLQACVIAAELVDAGLLSRALAILGPERAETLLASQPGVQARMVFSAAVPQVLTVRWPGAGP